MPSKNLSFPALSGDFVARQCRKDQIFGGGKPPRISHLSGTIGRQSRPIVPEKKDSWRAFALQTSLLNADCISPIIVRCTVIGECSFTQAVNTCTACRRCLEATGGGSSNDASRYAVSV